MRTIYPMLLIMAIGVAGLMWTGSGIGQVVGQDDAIDNLESTDKVEKQGEKLEGEEDDEEEENGIFKFPNLGDDSLIGGIIEAGKAVKNFAVSALLLPMELQRLGLPGWIARPLGIVGQAIAFIGLAQFIAGRRYD